ncbi:TetR/AcrR family transcriptional regulator [Kribbella sp. NBC_01505]|uniref:TetR/AcrR family transcriptional regulator n=1 Tax=Kribbella sp. NBC_01505 TaxID=2903580 RepID=UPI003866E15F
MPRIRGGSIEKHHELVWADLADATRRLLLERDYDSINMGHIAAEAGIARNTLYNYARDKAALVQALTERASRPMLERVTTIAASTEEPAADRMHQIVEAVFEASTDQALQPMFRPGAGPLIDELPKGPGGPFHAIMAEVENVVRAGITRAEFRDIPDVPLTVELLAGAMRAGAERIGRDPATYKPTVRATQQLIQAALTR